MTKLPPDTRAALAAISTRALDSGWKLARTPAGACETPGALAGFPLDWVAACVPGTVAAAIHGDLEAPAAYDADDWWYRVDFPAPNSGSPHVPLPGGTRHELRFDGLATLAHVWLNGTLILDARNMFRAYTVDVTALLQPQNQLAIAFRSLDAALAARRPRPRWKTALVARQNLRWARTTLLGRMPAWTPAIDPVGPWGPVVLASTERVSIANVSLSAWAEGSRGQVRIRAQLEALAGSAIERARLRVGEFTCNLEIRDGTASGALAIDDAPLWWPHTHGAPELLGCRLEIEIDGHLVAHDCGSIGFKAVTVDASHGQVRFSVNGVAVFCRGAVWTTADMLRLRTDPDRLRAILEGARDAGVNMLRIGGTMTYESDDFYALCDELGILVWQDFMFANMDYPVGDADFREEIELEASGQIARLARHPSVAAYCGGSEVAQQAAMLGLPESEWLNEFFADALPKLVARDHPHIPYFPSTPWGGALPIHVGTGLAHYYGVGAYRRPLTDLKAARVKFATECLGFSNVPDAAEIERLHGTATPAPHHPRWKAGVPRDAGSGYDFEDVRDFYVQSLFGQDPVQLRARDIERYYAVSRVASGEAMQRAYSEWRAPASGCGGALVWFYRDLRPGAGWGITGADGRPKAAWWYLKRAWAPIAVRVTDEGLDGLAIHVLNDSAAPLEGTVEIEMLSGGRPSATRASRAVQVPAHGAATLGGDALLGHFTDSTNAYRFGPAKHDVVVVRLRDANGAVLAEDFHFPTGLDLDRQRGVQVASAAQWDEGRVSVTLESDTFLQSVAIDSPGFAPDDNYFHLAPGQEKHVLFTRDRPAQAVFEAEFTALNAVETVIVRVNESRRSEHDETR